MDEKVIAREVDARGEKCPVPILKAKKALATMETGEIVRVFATDPAAVGDFQFFATQTGNTLIEQHEENGEYVLYLKRK